MLLPICTTPMSRIPCGWLAKNAPLLCTGPHQRDIRALYRRLFGIRQGNAGRCRWCPESHRRPGGVDGQISPALVGPARSPAPSRSTEIHADGQFPASILNQFGFFRRRHHQRRGDKQQRERRLFRPQGRRGGRQLPCPVRFTDGARHLRREPDQRSGALTMTASSSFFRLLRLSPFTIGLGLVVCCCWSLCPSAATSPPCSRTWTTVSTAPCSGSVALCPPPGRW